MVTGVAVATAGIHEHRGADDVGIEEDGGVFNAAVDMAFGSKVDDSIGVLFFKEAVNPVTVTDVQLDKTEVGIVHNRLKGGKVAGIGELIQADDAIIRMCGKHVEDEVGADETGTTGDNDGHVSTSGRVGR